MAESGAKTGRKSRMLARAARFFAPPFFKGDEDKTRRGRLLSAILLLDAAGMILMLSIDLFSGLAPARIILLEVAAVLALLAFRIPMHRGKITEASYGTMALFIILASTALVSLGTTRDPTLGTFILLVATAGLLLNRRAIIVITGACILAVSAVMIAETTGRLPAPRVTVNLSDWGTITVLLIASAWAALWFREGIEESLFRARQGLADRIKAEEALRASEERFRELSSLTNEGIMIHEDGIIHDANLAFARLVGYQNSDDLVGKNGLEIIPFTPESRERLLAHMRSGSTEVYEIELLRADGSRLPAVTLGKEITYRGRPMRLVSMRDISERKRAEEKLAKSERRFRLLSESLPQIVFETDAQGNITFANLPGIRSFGYTLEDLGSGINFLALIAPQDRDGVQKRFQETLRGRETAVREFQAIRKDGSPFPVILHADAILVEGVPVGIRGIAIDISDRKQSEDALRRSEEYFRSLIEKGSDVISVMDKKTIVQYISPSVERILGYKPEELIGTSGFALVHPDDLKRLSAAEDFLIILGTPGSESPTVELRDRHKDGTWRTLEVIARSILDANGELAIVTNAHDITERKRAEESLRQSAGKLRLTLKEAINSLSAAIEMRDPYTAGHQAKVTNLAEAIGRELHLSDESIEALQIAGIVHDIGKLSVPAEILSKPTHLTEMEYSLVKTHAETGYSILSKIDFPWPIAEIVYQHHERLDGSGYPRGLPGNDLLIEAKIIGVADTVEAMSSHRPYRPALGIEDALREISEKRGIFYDSDVVEACLRVFADKRFSF
jgi:PAS domain S-box-containing protein/putative nucleotidyltransferase with HDIG domain